MAIAYLDLESTGVDFEKDNIITIQYQRLNEYNGSADGELVILKSWESSEEDIVKKMHQILFPKGYPYLNEKDMKDSDWHFIPVGMNLNFELFFLFSKFKKYNLPVPDLLTYIYKKPKIDIRSILIIANNFQFKGSALNDMSNKKGNGKIIPELYKQKKYDEIVEYIKDESKTFVELLSELGKMLKKFFDEFK